MVKTAGKYTIFIIFSVWFISALGISLRVCDEQGVPLTHVAMGVPFSIEVSASGHMKDLEIDGITDIQVIGKQTSTQYINGVITVKYMFRAKSDKKGRYAIGPARALVEGSQEESGSCSLVVSTHEEAREAQEKVQDVFMRLYIPKKDVYVGEKIKAGVRFYYALEDITLDRMLKSDVDGVSITNISEPTRGTEEINGISYSYVQITWDMVVSKSGEIDIPAWGVEYTMPMLDSAFGGLRAFLNMHRQAKRAYSNAASLRVHELPAHDTAINGVGVFESFNAHVDMRSIKEGEACVVRLELVGSGNLDGFESLALHNMPDGLRAYDSKQLVEYDTSHKAHIIHEYIVQGVAAGSWHIPAQSMVYFDINRKQYVTLETIPLYINVLAQPKQHHQMPVDDMQEEVEQSMANAIAVDNTTLSPLNTSGVWYASHSRMIPMPWFITLLLLPLLFVMINAIMAWIHRYRMRHAAWYRKKYAYQKAYAALKQSESRKAYHEIYPIIIEFFADRSDNGVPEIAAEGIDALLKNAGFTNDELLKWHSFLQKVMSYAYAGPRREHVDNRTIFEQAYYWLNTCKEVNV